METAVNFVITAEICSLTTYIAPEMFGHVKVNTTLIDARLFEW